jgi:hypothetical protein
VQRLADAASRSLARGGAPVAARES